MMQTTLFIINIGFQRSLLTIMMKFAKKWDGVILGRTVGFVQLLALVEDWKPGLCMNEDKIETKYFTIISCLSSVIPLFIVFLVCFVGFSQIILYISQHKQRELGGKGVKHINFSYYFVWPAFLNYYIHFFLSVV